VNSIFFPLKAGIGLRSVHYQALLETRPAVGWLEAHSENYFSAGGATLRWLTRLRELYPLSLHGVGLSLGSTDQFAVSHLEKLKQLIARFEPIWVSEHLSWSSVNQRFFNELLPLPYNESTLAYLSQRIDQVQHYLGRQLLIENVSSYIQFKASTMPEWVFIRELVQRTGCGVLLDINNVYVNAFNHGFNPETYLATIPVDAVKEFHLAGFENHHESLLIDTHSRTVADGVWEWYQKALTYFGDIPTIIEWDNDIPELKQLVNEAEKADNYRKIYHERTQ
jgi:uncharacterized protein